MAFMVWMRCYQTNALDKPGNMGMWWIGTKHSYLLIFSITA